MFRRVKNFENQGYKTVLAKRKKARTKLYVCSNKMTRCSKFHVLRCNFYSKFIIIFVNDSWKQMLLKISFFALTKKNS